MRYLIGIGLLAAVGLIAALPFRRPDGAAGSLVTGPTESRSLSVVDEPVADPQAWPQADLRVEPASTTLPLPAGRPFAPPPAGMPLTYNDLAVALHRREAAPAKMHDASPSRPAVAAADRVDPPAEVMPVMERFEPAEPPAVEPEIDRPVSVLNVSTPAAKDRPRHWIRQP